jgi:hypothetical protein
MPKGDVLTNHLQPWRHAEELLTEFAEFAESFLDALT